MPTRSGNRFLLVYGSQTGQAQAISEEIAERADKEGLYADIHCLSQCEKKFFMERETCVVIVTSTTGDGEPPDTARKFMRRLMKRTLPNTHLDKVNYALLGLGDSNYTRFCMCGRNLDERLQQLGAQRFYDPGWADDAVGLEVVVEPWIDGLWAAVRKFLDLPNSPECSPNDRLISKIPVDGSSPQTVITSGQEPAGETGSTVISDTSKTDGTKVNQSINDSKNVEQSIDRRTVVSDQSGDSNLNNHSTNETNCSDQICDVPSTRPETDRTSFILVNGIKQENLSDQTNSTEMCNQSNSNSASTINSGIDDNTNMVDKDALSINNSKEPISGNSSTAEKEKVLPSLTVSVPPLSESNLSIPSLPPAFLKIEFHPEEKVDVDKLPLQNGFTFPSAASPVSMTTVVSMTTLTAPTAVKKVMCVSLDVSDCGGMHYQPGDAFSLVCPNHAHEVDQLLNRLGVASEADVMYSLTVIEGTKKRNACIPKFVPGTSTLRHVFTTCLDIRDAPKKAFLRTLVEYTSDESEKRRLQEVCSKQGNGDYTLYIREPGLSILDLLHHFPSCSPPIERLIEHLPRLQPRPYSMCSSPLVDSNQWKFVFNVVETTPDHGRTCHRKGVCTGWLEELANQRGQANQTDSSGTSLLTNQEGDQCAVANENGNINNSVLHTDTVPHVHSTTDSVVDAMKELQLNVPLKVPIFLRTNQHFHLPDDITRPLILIGPGTGVAPFLGFLDHRAAQRRSAPVDTVFGDIWLFFGCRHEKRDFLFRTELDHHVQTSTLTRLFVSFSRDVNQADGSPRYVQDHVRAHGAEILTLLEEGNAVVYVCGDAKNMAKDVNQAFVDLYVQHKGLTAEEGQKVLMKLRLDHRLKEDVWT